MMQRFDRITDRRQRFKFADPKYSFQWKQLRRLFIAMFTIGM